jgi:pyruvate carboxylase
VRHQYAAFESDLKAGTAEVYLHEMPGGQFTNLKEQARSLGLAERWHEVAKAYSDVNAMFGDIVKVTPSSKVVGDMALAMVAAGLTRADVESPTREVSFPDSVVSFFKGDLGQPPGGFPKALQAKVLKGAKPSTARPGAALPPADLAKLRAEAKDRSGAAVSDEELASYLMYPKVYTDFAKRRAEYGPVSALPTPAFFYGMSPGEELSVEIEPGKLLVILLQAISGVGEDGEVRVFFELNGVPRIVRVTDRSKAATSPKRRQAEPGNPRHIGSPMPGMVSTVAVKAGQSVRAGDVLVTIEAMKMETAVHSDRAGTIAAVAVAAGQQVDAKDLLVEIEAAKGG